MTVARTLGAVLVGILLSALLVSCVNDRIDEPDAPSGARPTLEGQVNDVDALLRKSIKEVGLDPTAGRLEVAEESCLGEGGAAKEVRYYYDEFSADRGIPYLGSLERYWERTDGFAINDPLQYDGEFATILATFDEFRSGAYRFPASNELAIGGSTPCSD